MKKNLIKKIRKKTIFGLNIMRNKSKLQIILLGIIFALSIIVNYDFIDDQGANEGTIEHRDETNLKNLKNSGYWTTNFIHVDGNWSNTEGSYSWCSGDGSWNNPYTIENVTIDASTSPTGNGIFINNSKNEYFIIRNCTIFNAGSGIYDGGIKLENTNNGTLSNNNCSNNLQNGIFLFSNCKNNTISGNTANNNLYQGIWLYTGCNNNTISGNSAYNNVYSGIRLFDGCHDNIISGNTVGNLGSSLDQDRGISLETGCNYNIISGNTANYNLNHGIYLDIGCNNNAISGNTANYNWQQGIYLLDNCNENIISGNTVNDNDKNGIYLNNYCNENTISGNTANGNRDKQGLALATFCDNNIISGNTFNDNYIGIYFGGECHNNTFLGNAVNDNDKYGIYLLGTCNENIISGNTFSNIGALRGIFLNSECDNNAISGNTVNNNYRGINLYNCDNNTIKGNIVFDNNVGIQLGVDCFDNILFYNYIFNNSNNNGYDSGSNYWDNGVIGNYWDDYTGIDADYDGIGDTPYDVPGGAGNKDNKPIMIYEDIFFNLPDDLTYEVGTVGHNITWIVINPSMLPLTFNVYMDGTSVKTGQLFPAINEIVINVDGLDSSIYGFTIEVADGNGGMFTDGVWVTVTNTKPIFTATPNDFSYEVGETGNNLSWTFSDASTNDPTYTLTRNVLPLIIDDPCISGEAINISVDGLGAGSYCFTIEIDDGYGEAIMDCAWVTVTSEIIPNLLFVEIIDQSFTLEYFNITSSVYNESGQGIDSATIQMWWNGIDVSNNVVDLGNGLYFVSLEPIVVAPGEDPILLTMIISAEGFRDKSIETYIAVDPDTMSKDDEELSEFPLIIIIIASTSIAGGIGVAGITIFLLRKRSRLNASN